MTYLRAIALLTVFIAACARPNDLPRRQDELLATAAQYQGRLEALKRRADALDQRRKALPQQSLNAASAEHALGQAREIIAKHTSYLRDVPRRVPEWTRQGGAAELQRQLDELRERLDAAVTEAGADLTAVEGWAAVAEQQLRPGGPPAAPPEPPPPADEHPAEPEDPAAPVR